MPFLLIPRSLLRGGFILEDQTFEFYGPLKMQDNPLWINVTALMQMGVVGYALQRLYAVSELQPRLQTYRHWFSLMGTAKCRRCAGKLR